MDRISFMLRRSMYQKKKSRKLTYMFRFLLILAVGGFLYTSISLFYFKHNHNPESVYGQNKSGIYVKIFPNASMHDIVNILKKDGLIKHPVLFRILSKINGFDGKYKTGIHVIYKDYNYEQIMKSLSSEPESTTVTIPKGFTVSQIAQLLFDEKIISSKEKFISIAQNQNFSYLFLSGISSTLKYPLEGYLFPGTYKLYTDISEKEILETMLKNFDVKFLPKYYSRAKELNMSIKQIITLASIIEKESINSSDKKIISGILHNRLKSKSTSLRKLKAPSTIKYIYQTKYNKAKQVLSDKDFEMINPYNTYIYAGLPVGPICSPSIQSIEAALYPDKTDYLFYVPKANGGYDFLTSLSK